tara:strand:- start:102 stop:470 length:369 start_codon:yes stop_codon:yes gene_type:complete
VKEKQENLDENVLDENEIRRRKVLFKRYLVELLPKNTNYLRASKNVPEHNYTIEITPKSIQLNTKKPSLNFYKYNFDTQSLELNQTICTFEEFLTFHDIVSNIILDISNKSAVIDIKPPSQI